MNPPADKLVDDYLKRLNGELRGLPRARRREVLEEISEHIAEARAELATQHEAEIRNLLDRVGDPADIAAEARERFGVERRNAGFVEIAALVLLLVGGFFAVIGWLVGVVLLWVSDAWTTRDKLIGTFVVPGGLALPLALLVLGGRGESCSGEIGPQGKVVQETCTGGSWSGTQVLVMALLVVLLVAPAATTVYLSRRLRREQPAPLPV